MLRSFLRNLLSGPIAPQLRKFVAVGVVAAGLQLVLLWLFVDAGGLHYLLGAVVAIECTIVFQYVLNNRWTFRSDRNTGTREFLVGLAQTNVVRGTAIPIQIGVLYALVQYQGVPYLLANAAGILVSGVYRYVFDARWTWG
ncbi:GtrA family protein [Salinarchaeum sp. Harcht-Bsk1]|uniref:GtrA family protein n=1 Tax=Salinarchaeum sp. Harcht-Bsk1 TaxID=1333523 RepID=UPI00034246F9|nr:GtrA family protein [Salinarchaeum sp. Harcht-Bsk1]AGN02485.1 GtrA family protein [Salinarchaeum sp. Harcht-Bsk1]